MSLNIFQHFLPGILPTGAVAINTHDPGMGKPMRQSCFHTLRAVAKRHNVLVAAFGAVCRKVLLVATMMAAQFLFTQVYYEAAGTAMAGGSPCT